MVDPYSFEALRWHKVIVRANGFVYRGVLVGADDEELYLRGDLRWVVLAMSTITDVERDNTREVPLGGWDPERSAGIAVDADGAAHDDSEQKK